MEQKCFLSYTGKNGRVASTSRGNGWTIEGMEAFNENLRNVCNDRKNRNDVFDDFFINFCKEKHKEELRNSAFFQVSRTRRRKISDAINGQSPKKARIRNLKVSELMDEEDTQNESAGF